MNTLTQERSVIPPLEMDPIPTSLPPLQGSDKTVNISGAELLAAVRLLETFSLQLKESITKIKDKHEKKVMNSEHYPMPPPELDNLFCTRTQVQNLIQTLKGKKDF